MNTAIEITRQVQGLLRVTQDGRLGAESLVAFHALAEAAPNSIWITDGPGNGAEAGASNPKAESSKAPESPTHSPHLVPPRPAAEPGYSDNFLAFVPDFIFQWEGTTWENDPDDDGNKGDGSPGNAGTKYGIDAASHPGINIEALNDTTATAVHWQDWLKAGCDKLSSPMAEVFYNCAMNMGLGEARRFHCEASTPKGFLDAQEAHYRGIAAANPVDGKYLRGWLDRTQALRKRFNLSV